MAAEARLPDPLVVFTQNPAAPEHELARLPAQVRIVLRLCDGTRTLPAICAASALTHEQTIKVIDRLLALKLVAARRAPTTASHVNSVHANVAAKISAGAVTVNTDNMSANANAKTGAAAVAKANAGANGAVAAKSNGGGGGGKAAKARPAAPSPAPAAAAEFSADEELFFASSIDHLVGDEFYE